MKEYNKKTYLLNDFAELKSLKRNSKPFPKGRYWIGCASKVFSKKDQKKIFSELSKKGAKKWNYEMTYKGCSFACYDTDGSYPLLVQNNETNLQLATFPLKKLIVCVPKKLAQKRISPDNEGWIYFSEDWGLYSSLEFNKVLFGTYQLDL